MLIYIEFTENAKTDLAKLTKEDKKLVAKAMQLIIDAMNNPFSGIGQPEALKGDLQGFWSRRITQKHRLIYGVKDDILQIASCYGHYGDK